MSEENRDTVESAPAEDADTTSPYVFETTFEAGSGASDAPGTARETVTPEEEGPAARGFQHGRFDYDAGRDAAPRTGMEHGNQGNTEDPNI